MCLHLPAGVHYYRACSGADSWPRDTLSLVGAVHCVQVSESHQIQFCRKGMPPVSLSLPEHHHAVLPPSLHNRVSVTATGLTRASLLVLAATYQPRRLRKCESSALGRALVTHFTVAGVTHCQGNVCSPADGDLDTLQEILDWVYSYLLLTPARVVVLTGGLNAKCRWVPHLPVSGRGPISFRGSGVECRGHRDIARWCVGGARGQRGELGSESVVEGAELAGEGFSGDGETASLRWAHELGRKGEVMEGGQHRRVVGWETGVEAHFSGVGSFRGRSEEGMVRGTHKALRAHPRGGLCKGGTDGTSPGAQAWARRGHRAGRGPSQPVPSAVRVHVVNLERYTTAHPDWSSHSPHLVELAHLKEQIRAAWDVILLEKDVGLAPLPRTPWQPTKVDYRRTLGARYVPPADPFYAVGVPVHLHQQAAVALEQLCQRHLSPLEALSLARVQAIMGWTSAPLGPPPRATIASLRAIIHRAAPGPSADPTFAFWSSSWHFADCKGYITAQEGRRETDDSLQGDLIRECRAMADRHPPPRHLYSHITGTWLDAVLDQVDAAAGRSADSCPATVGWPSLLQEPRICFSHAGLQVHDALPHARCALLVSHHAYAKSPPPQRHPALGE